MAIRVRTCVLVLTVCITAMSLVACKGKIKGDLVDNFGKPVAGASVRIENSGYQATSDEKGAFRMEYAPGTISVVFEKDGYVKLQKELNLADDSGYKMGSVTMTRFQKLRGVAVDNFGVPLADATVEIIDGNAPVKSGADGKFEIPGLAGQASIRVIKDGYQGDVSEIEVPEKEEVEIGNLVALRLPTTNGVLYAGTSDYAPIQAITLMKRDEIVQEEIGLLSFPRKVRTYSIKNTDELPTVPGPFVRLFDRSGETLVLVKVPRREVAIETYFTDGNMFNPDWEKKPRKLQFEVASDATEMIEGNTNMRQFDGNVGGVYCLIHKNDAEIAGFMEKTTVSYTTPQAWCFRVGEGGVAANPAGVASAPAAAAAPAAQAAVPAPAPAAGSGQLSCSDPSFCPDHPDAVSAYLTRICDGSFTADDLPEIQDAIVNGRLNKTEMPWIYNVFSAAYGYQFVKRPQLNTFFYGDDSAKWLPAPCLRFRNSLKSMSGLTKDNWAVFKGLQKLQK